jgi:hypothetical protein
MTTLLYKKIGQPVTMLFVAILCSAVLSSCKKEKVTSFNPVGYWNGNAAHHHVAILNKVDGKSRVYFRITGIDTAGATIGDGFYTVTGNRLKAIYSINNNSDSIFIETMLDQHGVMNGKLYTSVSPDIVDCNLWKQ